MLRGTMTSKIFRCRLLWWRESDDHGLSNKNCRLAIPQAAMQLAQIKLDFPLSSSQLLNVAHHITYETLKSLKFKLVWMTVS